MTDIVIADVSEFQGAVDWAAYGAQNLAVIIRVHNGWRPDNYWVRNRDGARGHVAWRGFYQYLPASVDPTAAAHAFQATTGPLLPGEVAILDLEEGTGDQRGRRQAWLDALQDPVEWVYSGLAFARAHLPGVGIEWIAAYGQAEPAVSHVMWQFTNARSFAGIARPCDASVFHGTVLQVGSGRGVPVTVLVPAGTTPTAPVIPPAPVPPQEDIMASIADLQTVVAPVLAQGAQVEQSVLEISHRVDADRQIPATYRLSGGAAVWHVHPGVGREHLTAAAYALMGSPRILPVASPTNPLWSMEILGDPGELYRKAGDVTGAAFLLAGGGIRHITAAEYVLINSPLITDLPATHPVWLLPTIA